MNSQRQRVQDLHKFKLNKIPGKEDTKSFLPLTKKLFVVDSDWKTENQFSPRVSLGIQTTFQVSPHAQVFGQQTLCFLCSVLSFWFFVFRFCFSKQGSLCSSGCHGIHRETPASAFWVLGLKVCHPAWYFVLVFIFFFLKKTEKKEYEVGWLGRWGRSGRQRSRRKNITKIYEKCYQKFNKI